eukprot:scaffold215133_cov39-Tisochrysis_lutea.AAC.5
MQDACAGACGVCAAAAAAVNHTAPDGEVESHRRTAGSAASHSKLPLDESAVFEAKASNYAFTGRGAAADVGDAQHDSDVEMPAARADGGSRNSGGGAGRGRLERARTEAQAPWVSRHVAGNDDWGWPIIVLFLMVTCVVICTGLRMRQSPRRRGPKHPAMVV